MDTDLAVEAAVRQLQAVVEARGGEDTVPPDDAVAAVRDVLGAQVLVEHQQRRGFDLGEPAVHDRVDDAGRGGQLVVVAPPALLPAALEPGGVVVRHVGRGLAAEQVQRHAEVEVEIALDDLQRNAAERAHVRGVVRTHQLGGPGHDPVDAGRADEHVVRLFLEHELTRPRQRVEGALLECAELVLAVPVGEVGEHVERQPVRGRLVEGTEDPR